MKNFAPSDLETKSKQKEEKKKNRITPCRIISKETRQIVRIHLEICSYFNYYELKARFFILYYSCLSFSQFSYEKADADNLMSNMFLLKLLIIMTCYNSQPLITLRLNNRWNTE